MGIGQKAMLFSYKVLAQAGYDILKNPDCAGSSEKGVPAKVYGALCIADGAKERISVKESIVILFVT